MKTDEERRRHAYVVVAIVGGGGLVLFVLARSAASTPAPAPAPGHGRRGTQAQNFAPNPANASLEESMIAAREAALSTYDQSAVAERGVNAQYALGLNQDATAKAISFNQNATQLKETGMTTTAYEAIAAKEAAVQQQQIAAQESVASQYAQAQQTQAQGSFWGNLLGGLGGIFGMLGFNQPAPTGYGVGYVNAADYANPFALQDPFGAIGTGVPPIDYTQGIPFPSTIGGG